MAGARPNLRTARVVSAALSWGPVYSFPQDYVSTEAHVEKMCETYSIWHVLGISMHNSTRYVEDGAFDDTEFLVCWKLKNPESDRVVKTPHVSTIHSVKMRPTPVVISILHGKGGGASGLGEDLVRRL